MKKTKYNPVKGARLNKKQAQEVGERLEWIRQKHGGLLEPELIVQDAKRKSSPLHKYFDWDEEVAAKKWWIEQAKLLVRSVEVVITKPSGYSNVRAFTSVKVRHSKKPKYVSTVEALSDKDYRNQMLETAMSEAELWQFRYSQFEELGEIFDAIKKTRKRVLKLVQKVAV